MNKKAFLKSIPAVAGSIYISFILETSIFSLLALGGIRPNILLIVTAMFGFMMGPKYGMVTGFFSGLVMDLFLGSYFGMYALIFLYLGLLNGLFARMFYGDDIKLPLFLIAGSDILFGLVIYGTMFFLQGDRDTQFYLLNVIIPEAVYTTVVALLAYYPMKRLTEWINREEKRGTRR